MWPTPDLRRRKFNPFLKLQMSTMSSLLNSAKRKVIWCLTALFIYSLARGLKCPRTYCGTAQATAICRALVLIGCGPTLPLTLSTSTFYFTALSFSPLRVAAEAFHFPCSLTQKHMSRTPPGQVNKTFGVVGSLYESKKGKPTVSELCRVVEATALGKNEDHRRQSLPFLMTGLRLLT